MMKTTCAFIAFAMSSIVLHASDVLAAEEAYRLTLKDHKFSPADLTIPAGKKVKSSLSNSAGVESRFAALVVSIVLAATKGVLNRGWWVSGGLLGGVIGAGLIAMFADAISSWASGMGQEVFNACVMLLRWSRYC